MTPFKLEQLGPMFLSTVDTELKKGRVALQREKEIKVK